MTIIDGLRQSVLNASERLTNAALAECRRRTAEASPAPMTGALAQSIRVEPAQVQSDVISGVIQATAEHASYTDEGTGIYAGKGLIVSRSGGPLRFYWILGPDGPGVYYRMFVKGQPAQHWFARPMPQRWEDSLRWASQVGAFQGR